MRKDMQNQMNSQRADIISKEGTILDQQREIASLNQVLAQKTDVEAQLDEAMQREEDNKAARENMQKELDGATDYVLELEEKVYKANKTSLELLKQLKDAEVEIETLKQYIIDLK